MKAKEARTKKRVQVSDPLEPRAGGFGKKRGIRPEGESRQCQTNHKNFQSLRPGKKLGHSTSTRKGRSIIDQVEESFMVEKEGVAPEKNYWGTSRRERKAKNLRWEKRTIAERGTRLRTHKFAKSGRRLTSPSRQKENPQPHRKQKRAVAIQKRRLPREATC